MSGAGGSIYPGGSIGENQIKYGRGGGGATDIRLNNSGVLQYNSLKTRIMVAAGGGSANNRSGGYGEGNGGAGGALEGKIGISINNSNGYGYARGTGGTQTNGGETMFYYGTGATTTNTINMIGKFGQGGRNRD